MTMEWQPIETAPKDETEVLACRAGKKWRQVLGWQWGSGGCDGWYNSGGRNYDPTHWMPLPEPPKEKPVKAWLPPHEPCSMPRCYQNAYRRGYCAKHDYERE